MFTSRFRVLASLVVVPLLLLASQAFGQPEKTDPLPSWNDGPTKNAILEFVRATTDKESPKYVSPEKRIATFDQDGTLWVEHPIYTQVMYCLDRVPTVVERKLELKNVEPFKTVLSGDREAIAKLPMKDLEAILAATLTGMSVDDFSADVKKWLATAKHPRWRRPYTELTYQPMLEVLNYFRANGFKTYIVTGGGQDFVRVYAEQVYGIPPEQVVGSAGGTKYGYAADGKPFLTKEPKLLLNDNNAGKPEGIHLMIGRRPHAAFGNSTGDRQMLEYTTAGDGARLGMLVLHDDAKREYAYGPAEGLPDSKVGAFTQALYDEAKAKGWTVISIKNDWKRVFSFDAEDQTTKAADPDAITAIDILLNPDATMVKHAEAANARLLKVFPTGFALDASHHPHVSLVQRFVRTADLDKVYSAVGKVFESGNVTSLKLEAFKYYYIPDKDLGLSGIVVKPTPELLKLEQDVITTVTPFTVKTGTSAAFVTTPEDPVINPLLIEYVSVFVPEHSGEHYGPHVTTGLAPRDYLDKMLAEPFETFTFSPEGAAVYHLGHFGTAAKMLKEFDLK